MHIARFTIESRITDNIHHIQAFSTTVVVLRVEDTYAKEQDRQHSRTGLNIGYRFTLKYATLEREKSSQLNSATGLEVAAVGTTASRKEGAVLRRNEVGTPTNRFSLKYRYIDRPVSLVTGNV